MAEDHSDTSLTKWIFNGGIKDIPDEWYDYPLPPGRYWFTFPFEIHWSRRLTFQWTKRNWTLSIWACLVYALALFVGQRLMRARGRPYELRSALTWWNIALAVYSILGFCRTTPEFAHTLYNRGFVHSVCQTTYSHDSVFCFWLFAFVGSKFVELFDTAFIVLRRRPLTFLHCYHHVTVLVYCWHGGKELTAAGRWFCWMNYGVHSVMYTYFALRSLGYRLPRAVSMLVTSLQLSQMFMGCYVVYTVFRVKTDAWHENVDSDAACRQSWQNLYFACAIYFSYFCLFLRFFINAYILRTPVQCKVPCTAMTVIGATAKKRAHGDDDTSSVDVNRNETVSRNGIDDDTKNAKNSLADDQQQLYEKCEMNARRRRVHFCTENDQDAESLYTNIGWSQRILNACFTSHRG